jgi:hypothetical protein
VGQSALGAVIMVGMGADDSALTPGQALIQTAHRASALDLAATLARQGVERVVVAAPTTRWVPDSYPAVCADDPPGRAFHFGERLADLIEQHDIDPVMYFGGGSAPLIDDAVAGMLVGLLRGADDKTMRGVPSHIVLTNNLHSSDWAAITRVHDALPLLRGMSRDNSLAWSLKESGDYEVRVLSGVRPATSMDIDTPSDLALIATHPEVQPRLREVIRRASGLLDNVPVEAVIEVMLTEGKTLALFGRVSPAAWQALNKASRVWTRVVAEERGMVASERAERGEVRSVLSAWISARGFDGFFADVGEMADAVLFDTRVLFAAHDLRPTEADRFASDLLMHDTLNDEWLRKFTHAAAQAPIPIILGGHSVVAGGLHALVEVLQTRRGG